MQQPTHLIPFVIRMKQKGTHNKHHRLVLIEITLIASICGFNFHCKVGLSQQTFSPALWRSSIAIVYLFILDPKGESLCGSSTDN